MPRSIVIPFFVTGIWAVAFSAGCSCNRQDNRPVPSEVGFISSTPQPLSPIEAGDLNQPEKGAAPKNSIEIHVVAKQWQWKFQHPNGIREVGEVHVPVGQPFKLVVTSEDVIHCLCIPDQKIKVDAIPGKWTTDWTTVAKVGRYPFHCGEFCGVGHPKHTGTLIVMERDDYEDWRKGLPESAFDVSLASKGRQQFLKSQCVTCHNIETRKGPILEGLWGKPVPLKGGVMQIVDESYIRESIRRPLAKVVDGWEPIMPAFEKDKISEEEMIALIEYIKSLKPGDTPPRSEKFLPPVGAPTEKK